MPEHMKFKITVEALNPDPDNESAGYIADTSTLEIVVEAASNFDALDRWRESSADQA